MEVTNSTTTATNSQFTTAASTNGAAKTPDYDAFLTLLVAQLKNQDPTNPTDSGEYLAQLASFSSVEQQIQTNTKLDSIIQSNLLGQAGSVIGRTVTSIDGSQTGVVISVKLVSNSLIANLDDGTSMPITEGIVIK